MSDENLTKHIHHPFYKKVDKLVEDVRMTQLRKGAEKYPEPFTPSNWTGKELAIHALQELRDAQVYVVGMLERIEELEHENELLRSEKGIKSALNDKAVEIIENKEQQNKRYRDLLNKLCDTDDIVEVYNIVDEYKALEGTE